MLFRFFNKRRSAKSVTRKRSGEKLNRRRPLTLDTLEDRRMLAGVPGIQMSGTTVIITGTTAGDTAQVSGSRESLTATLNGKSQTFKNITLVRFNGGDGNDTFKNLTAVSSELNGDKGADTLIGGSGYDVLNGGNDNDRLEGGGGNDRYYFVGSACGTDTIVDTAGTDTIDLTGRTGINTLDLGKTGVQVLSSGLSLNLQSATAIENVWGSDWNDVIYGNSLANSIDGGGGDDRLYGRGGNDILIGSAGNDAMFGGVGSDTLYGGADEDRFLVQAGDTVRDYHDAYSDTPDTDAKITFTNGKSNWTDAEIEVVDQAFAKLYDRTDNQGLMRDPQYAPELTFKKDTSPKYSGLNSVTSNGVRTISIVEWNEANSAANANAILTVIHEIGHNWDEATEGLGFFSDFKKLSGWTKTKPSGTGYTAATDNSGWYYKTSAKFAEDYGKNNPFDDWSTVWEAYFRDGGYKSTSPIAAKLKIVENFMNWAKAGMPLGF